LPKALCFLLKTSQIKKLIGQIKKPNETEFQNIRFQNLNLKDHLKIYQNGLKNKWRCEKKRDDDLNKIKYIKKFLKME